MHILNLCTCTRDISYLPAKYEILFTQELWSRVNRHMPLLCTFFKNHFTIRLSVRAALLVLSRQLPLGQGLLIHEVSSSHTTTHHSQ